MKPIPILLIITLLSFSAYAQRVKSINFVNPSFESRPFVSLTPGGWFATANTPDTYPFKPEHPKASDQETYLNLAYQADADYQEAVGQQLINSLQAGRTYTFYADLAAPISEIKGPAGKLTIGGFTRLDAPGQTLWESPVIFHPEWKKYKITFTTTQTINFITFVSSDQRDPESFGIYVDNLSIIDETLPLTLFAANTCKGERNGIVSAYVPGADDAVTYLWEPGGYTTAIVTGLEAGTYKVTVTDHIQELTAQESIDVKTSDIKIDAGVIPISCFGKEDAKIEAKASGGQPPYLYKLDNNDIPENLSPGNYILSVKDSAGCSFHQNIPIVAPAVLSAKKVSVKDIPCSTAMSGSISFSLTGGTPPYTFSIPDQISQQDSIIRGLSEGQYRYVVTDSHQCSIDSTIQISREWRPCAVFVPTAFSPNRDGINDVFRVRLQDDVSDYKLTIYGRWGQVIFETRNPETAWDGTLNGVRLTAGTYIWTITYTDHKKQAIKQQGNLNLIL